MWYAHTQSGLFAYAIINCKALFAIDYGIWVILGPKFPFSYNMGTQRQSALQWSLGAGVQSSEFISIAEILPLLITHTIHIEFNGAINSGVCPIEQLIVRTLSRNQAR